MWYANPQNPTIQFSDATSNINSSSGITCGSKSLSTLISESSTFKIATQVATSTTPSISMTGVYPDFLKCSQANLYIQFMSSDQSQVIYKSTFPPTTNILLRFMNGMYSSSQIDGLIGDCINKSMNTLIGQGKAFNLNTPILQCPSDITSRNAVVNFSIISTGNLILNYSQRSNTAFPVGQKTIVRVRGSHISGINLQCTFGITILDMQAPNLTCPANIIQQNNRVVNFAATAMDNSGLRPDISYSVSPGSTAVLGTTMVTVTATDGSGNQARCTFSITIVDTLRPDLTCPANIRQKDRAAIYSASATDNFTENVQISYSKASGSQFQVGETTVTMTAIDGSRNQVNCSFLVIIQEPEQNNQTQIIIIITSILGGSVFIASIVFLIIGLIKCKKHKRGCFKNKKKIQVQTQRALNDSRQSKKMDKRFEEQREQIDDKNNEQSNS